MKFLKAYWMLILAAMILIATIYYCYDIAKQIEVLEARMDELNAMGQLDKTLLGVFFVYGKPQ